jgi:hypothetical protein
MAFEVFKETGTRTKEFISVTETKAFGLSRAFLDKHGITNDHKAVILYDAEAGKIALHFSIHNPKFGFSVRISNPKHGATIIARSFFELKGIDAKKYAGRYGDFEIVDLADIGQNKDGQAFVITLKEQNNSQESENARPQNDVVIDDIGDEPINLDDIPF